MTLGFLSITRQEYIKRNINLFSYINLALQLSPINASMTHTSPIPLAVRGVTKGLLHQRRFELKDTIKKYVVGLKYVFDAQSKMVDAHGSQSRITAAKAMFIELSQI